MPRTEADFLHVLRWMRENVMVGSSIYRTTKRTIAIDPAVSLDSDGHPLHTTTDSPADLDSWFLNSLTGLACCCYMDALGKILRRGKRKRRLNTFAHAHMPDLVEECDAKGGKFSLETLYRTFRNGFVHQFADGGVVWARRGRKQYYWFSADHGWNAHRRSEFARQMPRGCPM